MRKAGLKGRLMSKQQKTWTGILLLVIAIATLSNPRCKDGCATWATQVLNHGLDVLV